MRVVAGRYRGKNLLSPKGEDVRPTTTRIKETLFNILQWEIPSARVLDLFAGSGSLGIECISRGAEHVTFADKSKDSIALIRENLKGIDGYYSVRQSDFMAVLGDAARSGIKYDIVFLDPPYASNLAELAIDKIIEYDLLSERGIIVFEHGSEKTYALADARFKQRTKKMGTVTAEFISRKRIALMAGSFDPITRGHEAVLDEALRQFDEVVVACLINPDKTYTFNSEMRLALVEAVCKDKNGARAIFSDKYAVEVAKEVGACALVRGLRGESDSEYETAMAKYNAECGFKTVFVTPDGLEDISSTAVREQLKAGDYSRVPAATIPLLASEEYKSANSANFDKI
ncbi:MAG: 16S rRNA (guanine(966)-N(2))-methyltransferase RsmD [Bacteroides sp.]|nr:16S rRNA (guanine(966)-N(2))-methyltransferase RsmD [Bacillota bacterium]MCM1394220.1 16S rRNA (guanine(966)-N(2))-methyltransferase RsmD [[Eubacterium] siraeum]MCM1455628.1 16S rRNA (guanine(966)-N(2))-methyltransferase RsmD [Bacteroides sp.]